MTVTLSDPARSTGFAGRRATAIANANWFRALASRALRDGQPESALRAAKARKAARLVVARARRDGLLLDQRVGAV
ncbi:hypothetical protein ACRAWG_06490 [Methylobacterium sp. P31]